MIITGTRDSGSLSIIIILTTGRHGSRDIIIPSTTTGISVGVGRIIHPSIRTTIWISVGEEGVYIPHHISMIRGIHHTIIIPGITARIIPDIIIIRTR